MGWTTPRTWVDAEVVTAAMLNTHVRDNENWLRAHHGCRLYKSADQTVANGNNDVISFNSEVYDTDGFHDTATNNSRITIPAGFDGYYLVIANATSDADATNHTGATLMIRKNAAGVAGGGTQITIARGVGHTLQWALPPLVWSGPLVATDYVECFFFSISEAHQVQGGDQSLTSFQMILLGN
jgi:hypothetical protein